MDQGLSSGLWLPSPVLFPVDPPSLLGAADNVHMTQAQKNVCMHVCLHVSLNLPPTFSTTAITPAIPGSELPRRIKTLCSGVCLYQPGFPRETEPAGVGCVCVCVCIKYLLFIYFEELVYVILELASMKSAEQAGNSGRNSCCSLEAEFLLSWKNFSFCSLKPSTNWIRPHHVIEGNLHQLK